MGLTRKSQQKKEVNAQLEKMILFSGFDVLGEAALNPLQR